MGPMTFSTCGNKNDLIFEVMSNILYIYTFCTYALFSTPSKKREFNIQINKTNHYDNQCPYFPIIIHRNNK